MLRPGVGYATLLANPPRPSWWVACRRPLLHAVVLGTSLAMAATRRVGLGLVISVTSYWSVVAAVQWLAAWLLIRSRSEKRLPTSSAIDLSLVANAPWLVCYVLFAAWASFPAPQVRGGSAYLLPLLAWAWSARLTFAFCRTVLDDDRASAWRRTAIQQGLLLAAGLGAASAAVQLWPRIIAWAAQ